jgi:hypothetical protein
MTTRIQMKSRVAKRVGSTATYDIFDGTISDQTGRKPKVDKKGFPLYKGLTFPVTMGLTIVDSTP